MDKKTLEKKQISFTEKSNIKLLEICDKKLSPDENNRLDLYIDNLLLEYKTKILQEIGKVKKMTRKFRLQNSVLCAKYQERQLIIDVVATIDIFDRVQFKEPKEEIEENLSSTSK